MNVEKLADVALDIGEVMLKHGAETYRVEDTMRRILSCAGNVCKDADAFYRDAYVTYTGIMVTLEVSNGEEKKAITKVRRIENRGANYNKIYLSNTLSRDLCAGKVTVEEAAEKIIEIREARVYPDWLIVLSTVIVSAMFAVLFGGGVADCLMSGLNGLVIVLCRKMSQYFRFPDFICNMLTSIFMAYLTGLIIVGTGWESLHQGIIITSSIMPLVPGVAITNAIRDTLQGDYMSGGSRAMEAFVVATALAVGIGFGLILFDMTGGLWF